MSETLAIRTAMLSDLAEVDALLARSYPVLLKDAYPPSMLVTAIPAISKAQPRLLASGTYFVVTDGAGDIIGAGGWTVAGPGTGPSFTPTTGHVRHVVTDHRRVREGIGRALMAHVFDSARSRGMAELDCLSTLMAVPFYAASGFKTVGLVSIKLIPGIDFPAILMQRSL